MNDIPDTNDILERDLSALFGLNEMSDEEKVALLDDIGSVVLESAILRLVAGMDEGEAAAFDTFVESHSGSETFIEDTIKTYPSLEALITEEVVAFKEDATKVLGE